MLLLKICFFFSQVLDDINAAAKNSQRKDDLAILKGILERRHAALNHDGKQWYSQLHEECVAVGAPAVESWLTLTQTPPRLSLIPFPRGPPLDGEPSHGDINLVLRLPTNPDYVVTVSTTHQELCVWNIRTYVLCFIFCRDKEKGLTPKKRVFAIYCSPNVMLKRS